MLNAGAKLYRKASQNLGITKAKEQEQTDRHHAKLLLELEALEHHCSKLARDLYGKSADEAELALTQYQEAGRALDEFKNEHPALGRKNANKRVQELLHKKDFLTEFYDDPSHQDNAKQLAHRMALHHARLQHNQSHNNAKDLVLREPGEEQPTTRHKYGESLKEGAHASASASSQRRPKTPHVRRTEDRDPDMFPSPELSRDGHLRK